MLEKIVDLHIHSKYSRACSKNLELPNIAEACVRKGIDIISTGDFTHPLWMEHIENHLEQSNEGVYRLKKNFSKKIGAGSTDEYVTFVLGSEIACIYKHKNAVRRLHILLFAPTINAAKKLNQTLEHKGVNIRSDGRPIIGLSAKELLSIALDIDPRFVMIPAHAWTPWFAVFGSKSGYDSLEDCFEELTPHIRAIETGLSSDPTMNRRLSQLDNITLISNSDAHGLDNLGREANMLAFEHGKSITFSEIMRIIQEGDRKKFLYTIEFYPEEGKYHHDGHADCNISLSPEESKRENLLCPRCKKKLTIGVLHRVNDLADRTKESIARDRFIPHRYIIPLRELLSQIYEVGVASKKIKNEYDRLTAALGSEFYILLHASLEEIKKHASNPSLGQAIGAMRQGTVMVQPGYDGVFGVIRVAGQTKKTEAKQYSLL